MPRSISSGIWLHPSWQGPCMCSNASSLPESGALSRMLLPPTQPCSHHRHRHGTKPRRRLASLGTRQGADQRLPSPRTQHPRQVRQHATTCR